MSNGPVLVAQIQGPPGPAGASVSSLATLAGLPIASTTFGAGTLVAYTPVAGGMSVYYQWAPGSAASPDGLTIVAGLSGGNWLLVRGIGGNPIAVHSVSYAMAQFDLGADFSASGLTCTMPTSPIVGWPYFVSVGAAGNLTVSGNGKTIDGQASLVLASPYQSVVLVYNGTEYRIF
jgi:hypothetical protein